uniref:protein xylosyltransferase n=1 Tax=Setaria digitata TaxID=48799 RepID=A0A915PQL3_9BILA
MDSSNDGPTDVLGTNAKWIENEGTNQSDVIDDKLSSCKLLSESLILKALSRMETEECRAKARDIVCNINRETPDSLPNTCPKYNEGLRGQYVGCFKDSLNSRLLNGHLYKFKNNSPSYCVNMCLRAGYSFAGIEYREECFCGDTLTDAVSLPDVSCKYYHCDNDSLFCGGYNAAAIYRTGVVEKPLLLINYTEPDDSVANVQILFLLQLNGRNIRQVNRLLRIIYSPKHYYIIHVDSRQHYLFEEMKQLVATVHSAGFSNIYLMEKRYATIWAGAALLSMVLEVLRTALYSLNWVSWDFMLNLSESNFPLLSMAELEFHLANNKGRIFLGNHGYDTARFIQKQGLEYVFMQCENRMWLLMKRTKFPKSIRLDGGSDWVVISRDFAEYALSDDDLPKNSRHFFTNVLLPVETFFHTLAANSKFCTQVVKGNLHLTNWKRRQGCRCAGLKKIVDWCGCSPLVFRYSDISRYSVEAVKNRVVFFGRKFDPMISQRAIAVAEAQALRFTNSFAGSSHPSFNKSWINVYLSPVDQSVLLESFAHTLLPYQKSRNCKFGNLLSVIAYKEDDEAHIQNVYRSSYLCENNKMEFIQVLVESINQVELMGINVDGYELQDLQIGAELDLKEEIFRKYHGVLSEEDMIYAKLQWRRIDSLPTSVHRNYTSPQVVVEWKGPSGFLIKRTKVNSYDSIYGGQYTQLFSNETAPGEWTVEIIHMDSANSSTVVGSLKFAIFSTADENIDSSIISKYFRSIGFCWEAKFNDLPNCLETPWSASFLDLKSQLFL